MLARWLPAWKGMRRVGAALARVSVAALIAEWFRLGKVGSEDGHAVVALLGTVFGSGLLLTLADRKKTVQKVGSAPSGEHIDGVRVYPVAGKFVASVETASLRARCVASQR